MSFKKVQLKIQLEAERVERELCRLALIFYVHPNDPQSPEHSASIEVLICHTSWNGWMTSTHQVNTALLRCRGALIAATDARVFSKRICALPRHPSLWGTGKAASNPDPDKPYSYPQPHPEPKP